MREGHDVIIGLIAENRNEGRKMPDEILLPVTENEHLFGAVLLCLSAVLTSLSGYRLRLPGELDAIKQY